MGKITTVYIDRGAYDYLRDYYKMTLTTMIDQFLYFINYNEAKLMKIIKKYKRKSGKRKKVTVSMPYVLHFYLKQFSVKYNVSMSTIVNAVLLFLDENGFGGVVNL